MVGKVGTAESGEALLPSLQTIKSYVSQLLAVVDPDANPSNESLLENQTVIGLVLNARDSLESALRCARRERSEQSSPNSAARTAHDRDDDVDVGSPSTDITLDLDLEDDLANVTTQDLIDEPDWDDNQSTSDASEDILDVPVSHKTDSERNNSSHTVDRNLPENRSAIRGANTSTSTNCDPADQIDEFADIDFDDDFSNDGRLEGAESGDPEELHRRETPSNAVMLVMFFLP